jgi:hypothetical protein
MRCVAGAGLLALVGCNQIFGLAPTQAYDAGIDVPPDLPHVVLDWQIATVFPAGATSPGAPDPALVYQPIAPAPRLRLAALVDPAAAPGDPNPALGKLVPVAYSSSDGFISIPRDFLTAPWRLEYTLADGVPHEVQWLPDDKQGHLTVPLFGRLARNAPPAGGGYTITPNNNPPPYMFPRVFTTGLWTEGQVIPAPTGTTIDYAFANAKSLSGTNGAPDAVAGDQALVVDYIVDGASGCRIAVGSATLAPPTLQMAIHSAIAPVWDAARVNVMGAVVGLPFIGRLANDLGTFSPALSALLYGSAASTSMPGLAGTQNAAGLVGAVFPVPVMATLLQCPYNVNPFPMTAQPALLDAFPRVLHVQLVDTRTALGITLISGMETVIAASGTGAFTMAFPAPLPTKITLMTPAKGAVPLDGSAESVDVGAARGPFTLAFTPEMGADLRADYYDVVLHRITGGVMTTERIYTVTSPAVRIDGATFVPGADYVFEIRAIKGHLQAPHGDFAPVDYPYGMAIVFARTFKAS